MQGGVRYGANTQCLLVWISVRVQGGTGHMGQCLLVCVFLSGCGVCWKDSVTAPLLLPLCFDFGSSVVCLNIGYCCASSFAALSQNALLLAVTVLPQECGDYLLRAAKEEVVC